MLTRRQSASRLIEENCGDQKSMEAAALLSVPDPVNGGELMSHSGSIVLATASSSNRVASFIPQLDPDPKKAVIIESKDFTLNKEKAQNKKLIGSAREHIKNEMKPKKNLVIELSTSAYELMNATIIDFLNRVTDDLQLQLAFEEEKVLDENGDNVETRYKVVNRKLDCNPGKIFKVTINCYHTTSRILVNGSRVELFVSIDLPLVKQQISQFCTDLTNLNQIFERTLLACNLNKHYQTQTTDKTEASMAEKTDCRGCG